MKVETGMNHQRIALLTDSCADIPSALCEQYGIFVLSLRLLFSDGEYLDGKTISADEVYERLPKELPVTSLPSAQMVQDLFEQIRQEGYQHVLAVHLSAGLSGTYNLVRVMAEDYPDLDIHVLDSSSGSLGIGMTLLQTAHMIRAGCSWEQIIQAVPEMLETTKVFFCVNTLEYLQKGGRIGKITAMTGTLLQIKPILTFEKSGQLINAAKGRGQKAAIERMLALLDSVCPTNVPLLAAVADGGNPEEGDALAAQLSERLPPNTPVIRGQIDGTLGAYVGPRLLGVGVQVVPQALR